MRTLLLTLFAVSTIACSPKPDEDGPSTGETRDTGEINERTEDDCSADSPNATDACYACGWSKNDPGTLVSTGNDIGDVIDNVALVDQCGEQVNVWDFYGEYHMLFMTAAW